MATAEFSTRMHIGVLRGTRYFTAMLRLLISLTLLLAIGCTAPVSPVPIATEQAIVPAEWAFLGQTTAEHVVNASEDSFNATFSASVHAVLTLAVDGATAAGWQEERRKPIFGGHKVYLQRADGTMLTITVVPEGSTTTLSALLVPPDQ